MSTINSTLQTFSYKTGLFFSVLALAPKQMLAFGGVDCANDDDPFGDCALDDPGIPGGGGDIDIRVTVLNLIKTILSYLALLAVIYIIYAGIRLMVSRGNEEAVGEGRKTIIYVLVGLIVIIFARFIVSIATDIILTGANS
jgi:hypothetical protein